MNDFDKAVEDILIAATDRVKKPRVHGNGFLQLDLNADGTRRLHIWHDDLPRQTQPTPIHDHVFDLRSTVLLGTLVHEELETGLPWRAQSPSIRGTHQIYRAQQEGGTQNTILVPDEGEFVLEVVQRLVLGAGSVYTFPAGKLHQTNHIGLTATVMDKVNAPHRYGRPRVLVPVGAEPDNEFDREGFDPEDLWPYVEEVLSKASLQTVAA